MLYPKLLTGYHQIDILSKTHKKIATITKKRCNNSVQVDLENGGIVITYLDEYGRIAQSGSKQWPHGSFTCSTVTDAIEKIRLGFYN
jgi:hypothetical protein